MNMTRRMIKVFAIPSMIVLIAVGRGSATETTDINGVGTTTGPVPVQHPRRHHKKRTPPVAPVTGPVSVASPDTSIPAKTISDINTSGRADSLGTNNPGSPNMGSADHVPGTTGTSGQ